MFNIMLSFFVIAFKPSECLWLCQAINFIWSQCLTPKNLISFNIFFGLTTFKHTILIWPSEYNIAGFTDKATILRCQSNLILVGCITIRKERLIHHKLLEFHLVEYEHSIQFAEEILLQTLV